MFFNFKVYVFFITIYLLQMLNNLNLLKCFNIQNKQVHIYIQVING